MEQLKLNKQFFVIRNGMLRVFIAAASPANASAAEPHGAAFFPLPPAGKDKRQQ
jgi:hypothetical protein